MSTGKFVANRLREVLLNGQWIANTNYKSQLESLSWVQATQKIRSLNTVAALTFHINYYIAGILDVFNGRGLDIHDQFSFDAPPIKSETDWQTLRNTFLTNAEKFIHHVEAMPEGKFREIFVDKKYGTYLRNIEGIIEHSYYHLGQISLLKKLIAENY
jgi:uncharacterized damage-inducible protein DinB